MTDIATLTHRFRLLETVPDLYLILSLELTVLTASDAYLAAAGLGREEVRGRSVVSLFAATAGRLPIGEVADLQASLQRVLSSRQPHQIVSQGEWVTPTWRCSHWPVLKDDGQIDYLIHKVDKELASDSRVQEKEALPPVEGQRARLEDFFRQAPAAICILDGPQLVFELVNPVYQQLFPGRALLGKPLLEALPEIVGQPIEAILWGVYRSGDTYEGREVPVPLARQQAGPLEDRYFNFIYQARHDQAGRVDGILVFAYEVHELVMARQALERLTRQAARQAQAFSDTLAALKDFVYTFDTQGRFTYSNQPLLDLLGLTLAEILGRNFHELPYPAELATTLQEQIARVVNSGQPVTDETGYQPPGGKQGYYEYIFMPVFDPEGRVALVAGSTRDITERKRAEEALRLKNEQLLKTNTDLDNFVYTASHDLKSPVVSLESLLSFLTRGLSGKLDDRGAEIVRLMGTSITRLRQTIDDLTQVARIQRDLGEERQSISFREVLAEVEADLADLLEESGSQLVVSLEMESVEYARRNVRSILYNLLSNALKYRSPERALRVEIITRLTEEGVVLEVSDNGLGLSASQVEKLFGLFKRFHSHVEGSGVGLYMIRRIVDNHGGHIQVESQLGLGTTFRVYFQK